MDEIEELDMAHTAACCAYMDADIAVKEARKVLDYDLATVAYTTPAANAVAADIQLHQHNLDVAVNDRNAARTRMFDAARTLDSDIDYDKSIKDD